MNSPIYVYDPTAHDDLSRVRGIGRFLQILHENLEKECIFTSNISSVPQDSTFINPFFNILAPPLITKRIAKKQIAVIHDLIPLKYPQHFPIGIRGNINVFRNKHALKHYDNIITNSETTKTDVMSMLKIPSEKITVIYPIVAKLFHSHNTSTETTPLPLLKDLPRYFLYVGDATWNKNLVNLALAIKRTNIPCIFVGKVFTAETIETTKNVWQKELNEFFHVIHNDPLFVFPGYVLDAHLIHLYKNSICNVLVSKDEGFGFSYVEAGTLGTPSVLSDIPALHETAQKTALFANPTSSAEIAQQLQTFANDPQKREVYGNLAVERSHYFVADIFKKNILSLCQS